VDGAAAAGFARPEKTQHQAARLPHEKKYRTCQGEKCLHRRGYSQGNLFGPLQGQSFRNKLAQKDVKVGDQSKGDHDGDAVGVDGRVRNLMHELQTFHEAGDHRFADPPQGKAHHRDT
jgi:hypothetical protein